MLPTTRTTDEFKLDGCDFKNLCDTKTKKNFRDQESHFDTDEQNFQDKSSSDYYQNINWENQV